MSQTAPRNGPAIGIVVAPVEEPVVHIPSLAAAIELKRGRANAQRREMLRSSDRFHRLERIFEAVGNG